MLQKAHLPTWVLLTGALFLSGPVIHSQTVIERPQVANVSSDHGPLQPSQPLTFTVHLKLRNQAGFDKVVQDLYTPGSPAYHQWLSNEDIAKYGPSSADVETVTKELKSHGLSVLSVSPDNLSIRARGPASSVENAFHTQIHEFERQGRVFHANVTPAQLEGPAGALVHSVTGLTSFQMRPFLKFQVDPKTGKPRTLPVKPAALAKAATGGFSSIATNNCFKNPSSITLTTQGQSLPVGQYYGNIYDQGGLVCSWTPSQLQQHYGLDAAYKQGLTGKGQTIVIVDGPTDGDLLTSDLKLFSQLTGLPGITSSNFKVLYPDGKPTPFALTYQNWQGEASLDVEWAHSIAPGANIIIEIMPTQDWDELEYGIDYARTHKLGNVISNSYGYPEALFGAHTVAGFEQVLKAAAAAGIAVNFSSGDGGDEGTGSPSGGGQSYPATSEYVTAIGGTSIGIPNGTRNGAEVGWGNNAAILSAALNSVFDPPINYGFLGGSGGGESTFITKPWWEKSLSGKGRVEPDISALADPYTGAVFVEDGLPQAGIGGTSLACPIFSAIWAIADQKAGKPLGQAAPLIYKLSSSAVSDVAPVSSPTNIAGIIFDSSGATYYSSDALLAPLYTTTQYFSAAWNINESGEIVDLSFGTDTSLTITKGWDNVTGRGVPKGLSFINAAAALK
jgi:subtilase family serine protease